MKISKAGPKVSSGPITAENYTERACEFVRMGLSPGWVVIRSIEGTDGAKATGKPATVNAWNAWMMYFARLGVPTNFARKFGKLTVPTMFPLEFDSKANEGVPHTTPD